MDTPYDPDLFDLMTPEEFAGDAAWYEALALKLDGPVLELGAGTGRIALRLALAGVQLCALEREPAMVERLRKKLWTLPDPARALVEIVMGDMREVRLARRFRLVICPLRTFSHLLTEQDRAACLARTFEHLEPGGTFAFHVENRGSDRGAQATAGSAWRWVGERELENGERIVRSEAARFDAVRQRVDSRARFEHCDARGTLLFTYVRALELAWLEPHHLEALLADAGFRDVRLFGGFDERPLTASSEELVVRATRASI